MKIKKRYVFSISLLVLIFFLGSLMTGYKLTEDSAIRNSYPNQNGEKVYEKQFGNKKVVILDTGRERFVKLIKRDFGILYRATDAQAISAGVDQTKMKYMWSGTLREDQHYDTLLAAEVLDSQIVTVVVSNENNYSENLSLEEVKEQSSVYLELEVIDGYAGHYLNLSTDHAIGFNFRGLNAQGDIVVVN